MVNSRQRLALNKGRFALIDKNDFECANKFRWTAHWDGWNWYAIRHARVNNKWTTIYLHRFLMDASPGTQIDHADGNGLNCTRDNMRMASNYQNQQNQKRQANNSSGVSGVCWYKPYQKWLARIGANGKKIHLGYFESKADAKRARDEAAIRYHGEFARLNDA